MKVYFHFPNFNESIFSKKQIVDMDQVIGILLRTRTRLGMNKSQIARKLGISSQLYGQYENGTTRAGIDFYKVWNDVFPENKLSLDESTVSHETINSAPPGGTHYTSLGSIAVTLRELAAAVDKIAGISQGVKNEELDKGIDNLNRDMKDV